MYPSIIITLITILFLLCLFMCLHKTDQTQTVINEAQEQVRVQILLPNSRNENQGQNEVDSPPKPNDEEEILTNNDPPPSYEEATSSHQT